MKNVNQYSNTLMEFELMNAQEQMDMMKKK